MFNKLNSQSLRKLLACKWKQNSSEERRGKWWIKEDEKKTERKKCERIRELHAAKGSVQKNDA